MTDSYNNINNSIRYINIDELNDYVLYNLDTHEQSISIYNIIIGSKTQIDTIDNIDPNICRNHEFPKFVENLMFKPELQMSPSFIQKLSSYKDFTIIQYLFLIDPAYNIEKYREHSKPVGLLAGISLLPDNLIVKHNIINNTLLTVMLKPIIVSYDITEQQIESVLELIYSLGNFYSLLVNILDCSSNTILKMYCKNIDNQQSNNKLHLTLPECLLIDSRPQYLPIITYNENVITHNENTIINNTNTINTINTINTTNTINITNITNTATQKQFFRWINYRDDSHLIQYYKEIASFCTIVNNTLKLIIILYKQSAVENSLISLHKLWVFTTYSTDYKIKNKNINSANSANSANSDSTINFSNPNFSFSDFASYWKNNDDFRCLSLFDYDSNPIILKKYITYFVNKYHNITGTSYLGLNPSIVDYIKLEAFEIIKTLEYYYPNDIKYVTDVAANITRNNIRDYLTNNGHYF